MGQLDLPDGTRTRDCWPGNEGGRQVRKFNVGDLAGADHFALTSNDEAMNRLNNHFDFIVDTVSAPHGYTKYLKTLDTDGVMICVGAPPEPTPISAFNLLLQRQSIVGSVIGGIQETQEILDYCPHRTHHYPGRRGHPNSADH